MRGYRKGNISQQARGLCLSIRTLLDELVHENGIGLAADIEQQHRWQVDQRQGAPPSPVEVNRPEAAKPAEAAGETVLEPIQGFIKQGQIGARPTGKHRRAAGDQWREGGCAQGRIWSCTGSKTAARARRWKLCAEREGG